MKLTGLSEASASVIVSVSDAVSVPSSATVPVATPPMTGASSLPLIVIVTVCVVPSVAVNV